MSNDRETSRRVGKPPVAGTRRRGSALEGAILQAAFDVLVEAGYAGFTFEAVAARAGTSRPVLYRRWPSADALLLAVIADTWKSNPIRQPETGSLRGDAIAVLRSASAARAWSMALLSAQMSDYFRKTGTSFRELRDTVVQSDASPFDTIFARALARGEQVCPRPTRRVMNLPFDLLRYEILTTLQPVPDATIVEIVDDIWLPLVRSSS